MPTGIHTYEGKKERRKERGLKKTIAIEQEEKGNEGKKGEREKRVSR